MPGSIERVVPSLEDGGSRWECVVGPPSSGPEGPPSPRGRRVRKRGDVQSAIRNPKSEIPAWFKTQLIWVAVLTTRACRIGVGKGGELGRRQSVPLEPLKAQQVKPVRVRAAGQQFGWAVGGATRASAAGEAAVVKEEPQQVEVVIAELAA